MSDRIQAQYYENRDIHPTIIDVDFIPDSCPLCGTKINPVFRYAWFEYPKLQAVFQCPSSKCGQLFIAYYAENITGLTGPVDKEYKYKGSAPWRVEKEEFPAVISKFSQKFSEIYNEAKEAEKRGLKNICGAGYRKALEFLIKDYLINEIHNDPATIRETKLGVCIDRYVESPKIKESAKRAAWLGNDETHYYRTWEDKDLEDLKRLLKLTLHWIEDECDTRQAVEDMPDRKGKVKK
jgi:hypothetical protein